MVYEAFQIFVDQTIQVTALACVVFLIVRLVAKNRPHLAHALWLLVLIKCVTPPILSSSLGPFCWAANQRAASVSTLQSDTIDLGGTELQMRGDFTGNALILANQSTDAVPIAIDRQTNSGGLVVPGNDLQTARALNGVGGSGWQIALIAIWASGVLIAICVAAIRLALFTQIVRRNQRQTDARLLEIVARLRRKLGVTRNVRLLLVDAPVGPAVFGVLRPTILIPTSIVDQKTASELEPLLAHELIHIRRGDLWWAILQTLSHAVFWFHPAVRWIVKRVTIECERSCDEETVVGLGCRPATYARGLLDVLEHRHRLRVAPALPGVRPVDITSARLERVMKIGIGNHRRTPIWIWGVLLVGGAVVLPGAPFAIAHPSATNHVIQDETSSELKSSLDTAPSPNARHGTENSITVTYDVEQLLGQIQESNPNAFTPEIWLLTELSQPSMERTKAGLANRIELSISAGKLVVLGNEREHQELESSLDRIKSAAGHQQTISPIRPANRDDAGLQFIHQMGISAQVHGNAIFKIEGDNVRLSGQDISIKSADEFTMAGDRGEIEFSKNGEFQIRFSGNVKFQSLEFEVSANEIVFHAKLNGAKPGTLGRLAKSLTHSKIRADRININGEDGVISMEGKATVIRSSASGDSTNLFGDKIEWNPHSNKFSVGN